MELAVEDGHHEEKLLQIKIEDKSKAVHKAEIKTIKVEKLKKIIEEELVVKDTKVDKIKMKYKAIKEVHLRQSKQHGDLEETIVTTKALLEEKESYL